MKEEQDPQAIVFWVEEHVYKSLLQWYRPKSRVQVFFPLCSEPLLLANPRQRDLLNASRRSLSSANISAVSITFFFQIYTILNPK